MTRGLAKPEGDVVLVSMPCPPPYSLKSRPSKALLAPIPIRRSPLWSKKPLFSIRNNLEANALASYRKSAAQWTDAVWVRGRIFELEESLATQAAFKAAAISPDAKTFALMIGISKYQKLPQDLWLQFADARCQVFQPASGQPARRRHSCRPDAGPDRRSRPPRPPCATPFRPF